MNNSTLKGRYLPQFLILFAFFLFANTQAQNGRFQQSDHALVGESTTVAQNNSSADAEAQRGGCALAIECPNPITVDVDAGLCTAVVTVEDPMATVTCAGPAPVTLSHSTDNVTITAGSVACVANDGSGHVDNSYLRVYDLAQQGVTTEMTVTAVEFGIESADSPTGNQPVTVNLYSHDPANALEYANFTLIGTTDAMVPDQAATIYEIPISATVPAGSTIVVELFTPDGGPTDTIFLFIGSNAGGQTGPSYLASATCGAVEPSNLATLGFPMMHMILNVKGTIEPSLETTVTLESGLASGSAFPLGTTTNTYQATDDHGNTETCTVDITVEDPGGTCVDPCDPDGDDPTAACQDITIELDPDLTKTINAADLDNGSADDCTALTFAADLTAFTCDHLGENNVTLTVSDVAGNSANCTAIVTVNENAGVSCISGFAEALLDVEWSVYPNPSAGQFSVEINNADRKDLQMTLFDVLGQIVYQSEVWTNSSRIEHEVDMPLLTGIYILTLESEERVATKKVIVQ